MYTLEQLTKALPTLDEAFRIIDSFDSLSIKHVCGAHLYYTDGEAQGAVAVLTIGRKNSLYIPDDNNLSIPEVGYCSLYIFPDGNIMSHFMKSSDEGYTDNFEYILCVGIWLGYIKEKYNKKN